MKNGKPATVRLDQDTRRTLVEMAAVRSLVQDRVVSVPDVVRELVAQARVREGHE